jgi:hypothetical protein
MIHSTTSTPSLFALGMTASHPWLFTRHCLRDHEGTCCNDHTGCIWNDGHNECGHSSPKPDTSKGILYDCPLKKKETE